MTRNEHAASQRQATLIKAGLLDASRDAQREFWSRQNKRDPLRRTGHIADSIDTIVTDEAMLKAKRIASVVEAWDACVHPRIRTRTRPESLERGKLKVIVDSASTRYHLRRVVNQDEFIKAINEHPAMTARVDRIEYEIGDVCSHETDENPRSTGREVVQADIRRRRRRNR